MAQILRILISKPPAKYNLIRQISCQKPLPQYTIRNAYPCDYDKVMNFMVDTYMCSEPSMVNIGLAGQLNPTLLHIMNDNIHEGLTVLAEDRCTNCVVGAAVNVHARRSGVEKIEELADCCECGVVRDLLKFYTFVSRQADLWTVYCLDDVFECAHVAVHPDHCGQGLGKQLIIESWILARDLGYRLFRLDCSSSYSSRIAESYSWKCIYSIPYHRYFANGEFVFKNVQEPHTEMKIFVDRLNYYKTYYPPCKRVCK